MRLNAKSDLSRPSCRLVPGAVSRSLLTLLLFVTWVPSKALAQVNQLEQLLKTLKQNQAAAEPGAEPTTEGAEVPPPEPPLPELTDEDLRHPRIPVPSATSDVKVTTSNGNVTITAREAPVTEVLDLLADTQKLNVVFNTAAAARPVSITLRDVPWQKAMDAITSITGLVWVQQEDIILVSSVEDTSTVFPAVQERAIRVFDLDFASVTEVQASVELMISPVGKISVHQSLSQELRQTRNSIVVEDLPPFLARIEEYINQVDQPPRQVMIEARVLQIRLQDNYLHGINLLEQFLGPQSSQFTLTTRGLANPNATQAFLFTLAANNLNTVLEAIERTTDSKTLASPRVMCINGQEARVQVGGRLGFRVLTTTQTSTLEQVQFLETGVILRITPFISRDNQVLMRVIPEVTTGQINQQGLPEAQTTAVETQIMLPDGQGMIIGGLMQENYQDRQQKVPVIGDIFLVGRLFQRREVDRDRAEVIIALVPRIVPYGDCQTAERDREELARTDAQIYRGNMAKNPRPWEPRNYDACENPRRLRDLLPWDRKMRPRNQNPTYEYPTDPHNTACLEDGNCEVPPAIAAPLEMIPEGSPFRLPEEIAIPSVDAPVAPLLDRETRGENLTPNEKSDDGSPSPAFEAPPPMSKAIPAIVKPGSTVVGTLPVESVKPASGWQLPGPAREASRPVNSTKVTGSWKSSSRTAPKALTRP